MSAKPSPTLDRGSPQLGATLITLSGLGLVAYSVLFLIRNFAGFIELGLTPAHVGGTPDQIRAFSPQLYSYISHLQVALAGALMALGIAVISLAWFGIRKRERWAVWTALAAPLIALSVGVPLHYAYGLATLGHLGPIYLNVALLLAGITLAHRALHSGSPGTDS